MKERERERSRKKRSVCKLAVLTGVAVVVPLCHNDTSPLPSLCSPVTFPRSPLQSPLVHDAPVRTHTYTCTQVASRNTNVDRHCQVDRSQIWAQNSVHSHRGISIPASLKVDASWKRNNRSTIIGETLEAEGFAEQP